MAMTPAEKMKAYRNRLKEKGGKQILLNLSPEQVRGIEIIGKYSSPGLEHTEIIGNLISFAQKRTKKQITEILRLKDEFGASDEIVRSYADYLRWEVESGAVTTAEQYLELSREIESLNAKYLQQQ